MKINIKTYKAKHITNYIKKNNFFLIMNGVNKNSINWIQTEQELQKLRFCYYQLLNKISTKKFHGSIYKKAVTVLNGSTFFIKPCFTIIIKHTLLNNFKPLVLAILALKVNNRLYSFNQVQKTHSVYYEKNNMLVSQFFTTYLKLYCSLKY